MGEQETSNSRTPLDRTSAPFNMAIATLMEIRKQIDKIVSVSTMYLLGDVEDAPLTPGQALHTKARMVKQLLILSAPLLQYKKYGEWINKTKSDINLIIKNLKFGQKVSNQKVVGQKEIYDFISDDKLDDIVLEISEKIQSEHYFMPPKSDPRFGWSYQ